MTEYQIATLAVSAGQLLVGLAGVSLVGVGIRAMTEAAKRRDRQLDEHRRDADQRHAEAMHAGDLREKRDDARHAEAMRSLEAIIKGMERQTAALQTVIERTGTRA